MSRQNEIWGSKETISFLSQSNEALRLENLRLMDENERLINNIDVIDAELVSNGVIKYYEFINNFNYTLKNK